MDNMCKMNVILNEMEKLNLIIYSENPEKNDLNDLLKNLINNKDEHRSKIYYSSNDNIPDKQKELDNFSTQITFVMINNFSQLKNFLLKCEKFSTIILVTMDESSGNILSQLKSLQNLEKIVSIYKLELYEKKDENGKNYESLREGETDDLSCIKQTIKLKNKSFLKEEILENLRPAVNSILEYKIRRKFLLSDFNQKNSKFLFFDNENDYQKYFELHAFKFLINSDKIKADKVDKLYEENLTKQKNGEISELFLKNNWKFHDSIQRNLRSLNYETIYNIRGVLKDLFIDLKYHSENINFTEGEKFFFQENLTLRELLEIIKNFNKTILLKDFTFSSEKLENIFNFNDCFKNCNLDENMNNSYPTIFSVNMKNLENSGKSDNIIKIKNLVTEQKYFLILPFSLLKIEEISIEYEHIVEFNHIKPYIKIECTLISDCDILKEDRNNQIWDTYCHNLNQLNYSEELFYFMDFIFMLKERNEFKNLIEEILEQNSYKLKLRNFKQSDYLLLGKVYNYLGDYYNSNLNFKRSINSVIHIDAKSELSLNKGYIDIAHYFIKLNLAHTIIDEKEKNKEALKLLQEYAINYNNHFNKIDVLVYNKAIIELIKTCEIIDAIAAKSLKKNLEKIEISSDISNEYSNLLVKLLCLSGDSDEAALFYQEILRNQYLGNMNFNIFIGAIHFNILLGFHSNFKYYRLNCIEGYCDSKIYNNYFDDSSKDSNVITIDKELIISNSCTKIQNKKITIMIPDGLSYYTSYYDTIKPTITNEIIYIKILPHTVIESMGNNIFNIKKNTILEKLSKVSLDEIRSKTFFLNRNFNYPFQIEVEVLSNSRNVIDILSQIFFLIISHNKLKEDEFQINEKLRIQILKKFKSFLDRIAYLISLPKFDLFKIINNFRNSNLDLNNNFGLSENKNFLNYIYVLFKIGVKISIDNLKKDKNYSVYLKHSNTIEYLENKITIQSIHLKKRKFRSPIMNKLFEGKISLNEFVSLIGSKFGKRDKISVYLLKTFVIKYLNNLIIENLISNLISESENILYKNIDNLRWDGRNSINIFLYQKIIKILKIKQKISDLSVKEQNSNDFLKIKIKCEYNNLQEELFTLFKLIQENLSYFLMGNFKIKLKTLFRVFINHLFNKSNLSLNKNERNFSDIFTKMETDLQKFMKL